ncbi:MAG TPA: GNAT family N-acetyltransferase [Cellulomonas sp.]|nr:GNAT family N-acetyltransferase [Cellulomonas sp.]
MSAAGPRVRSRRPPREDTTITTIDDALDNPAWYSLTGAHSHLAEGSGDARRYRPTVSPFVALRDVRDPAAWADLVALVGPGQEVPIAGGAEQLPDGWTRGWTLPGVQMVGTDRLVGEPDDEVVVLGADDVPEMLALTERTKPGPFAPETYLMGTYRGVRRDGRLVAMAGERLRPGGATEVSAVCTDEAVRGQGLASRLVLAVAHGIRARDELPILHAATANEGAIRLYRSLGFEVRKQVVFGSVLTPAGA